MTPLDKTLKRAITLKGLDYVVTLSPEGIKLSRKGHRLGAELKWSDLISGDSALAVALQASVGRFEETAAAVPKKSPVARDDRASGKRSTVRKVPPPRRRRR
jgi:hypothetical protein